MAHLLSCPLLPHPAATSLAGWLQEEHSLLAREREALRRRTDALQMTLMQSQGQGAVGRDSSPQAILQKVGERASVRTQPAPSRARPAGSLGFALLLALPALP